MRQVSVVGLGPMGSAIAAVLLRDGFEVSVWNRTPAKADLLVEQGAIRAAGAAAAAAASPVTIVCVADYGAADGILKTPEVTTALAGRVLIQLSTGSPRQAREAEAWAQERRIEYLDGAILVTPGQIGGPESAILVSGSQRAYQAVAAILKCLAASLTYLGPQVGAAAALDLAFLSHFFGGLLGFYHGARILEVEGMRVSALGAMIAEVAPALGAIIKHDADVIQTGRFGNPESTLRNSATVVDLILRQAQEAGIDAAFPEFAAALFRRGMAAGYGSEDVAALVKVLRPN